jgi:ketosteroid isomerase-like protein
MKRIAAHLRFNPATLQQILLRSVLISVTFPVLFAGCMKYEAAAEGEMTEEIKAGVSENLERTVLAFLRSWEPPFYPDSALALFTRTTDFSLAIDGWNTDSYEDWAAGIPNYMSDDATFFTSYKHEVKEIRTVPLAPDAGVVTIVYVWDRIDRDGIHERTDGVATMACRKEAGGWKIVHYHGSHGEDHPAE